jgi:hypothetical protein
MTKSGLPIDNKVDLTFKNYSVINHDNKEEKPHNISVDEEIQYSVMIKI